MKDAYHLAYEAREQQREELIQGLWEALGPVVLLRELADIADTEAELAGDSTPSRRFIAERWRRVASELRRTAGKVEP